MTVLAAARTPTGRKQQLAALLRHLREHSRWTQRDAGVAVWPKASPASGQNKIARLESGNLGIDGADLRRLLELYAVTDERVVDLALQLQADTSQRGRWSGCRSVYPEDYRPFIDLEEDAELIRYVTNERIPDLLQCTAYACAEFHGTPGNADGLAENTVQATLSRQRSVLFRENPALLHCVLSESCIRRVQGDEAVMREQLDHLRELSEYPQVTIQIVPFKPQSGAAVITEQGILERFALFRLPTAGVPENFPPHLDFVFTRTGNELTGDDDNVPCYELMWNQATGAALSPERTRDFLAEAAADFGATNR